MRAFVVPSCYERDPNESKGPFAVRGMGRSLTGTGSMVGPTVGIDKEELTKLLTGPVAKRSDLPSRHQYISLQAFESRRDSLASWNTSRRVWRRRWRLRQWHRPGMPHQPCPDLGELGLRPPRRFEGIRGYDGLSAPRKCATVAAPSCRVCAPEGGSSANSVRRGRSRRLGRDYVSKRWRRGGEAHAPQTRLGQLR